MNKLLLLLTGLLISIGSGFSQNMENSIVHITDNSKCLEHIKEVYGEERMASDEQLVKQLIILLKERVEIQYVTEIPEGKYTLISTVGLHNESNPSIQPVDAANFDAANFNPLIYNWNYFDTKYQTFRIDGTNYMMIVAPQKINQQ